MAEPRTLEDEATLYVLGQLSVAERRVFEGRMERMPELQALVRDLEEGAVALALTVPEKRAPAHVWRGIDEAIHAEQSAAVPYAWFWKCLRNGWAFSVVCLVGWALYALWEHHDSSQAGGAKPLGEQLASTDSRAAPAHHSEDPVQTNASGNSVVTYPTASESSNQARHIHALEAQIVRLDAHLNQLSAAFTQQQALLSESDRLTVLRLAPLNSIANSDTPLKPPSPELQRALFLGLARHLGWLPVQSATLDKPKGSSHDEKTPAAQSDNLGVDFVDLPAPGSPANSPAESAPAENLFADNGPDPSQLSVDIPVMVYDDKLFMALDSGMIAADGGPVTLTYSTTGWSGQATFTVTGGPVLVTLPMGSEFNWSQLQFSVSSGTGSWWFGTQYFIPSPSP